MAKGKEAAPAPAPEPQAPVPVAPQPEYKKDTRSIEERWCSLKRRLFPNCIVKNGSKPAGSGNSRIDFLKSDDLMELVRQLLGEEGLDVRCGMSPKCPPKEILVKSKTGGYIEWQCCFRITCKANGEKDVDWMWAQDRDIQIAGTYAYKNYIQKRLQIAGGGGEGVNFDEVEPMAVEHLPHQRQDYGPINVTPQQQQAATINNDKPGKPAPKSTGAKGPEKPKEPEPTSPPRGSAPGPESEFPIPGANEPAEKSEINGMWNAFTQIYKSNSKAKWVELYPQFESLHGMTVGEVMHVWEHINDSVGKDPGF